ncbi:MAG: FIST C-terminal domain-containing protein [Myxococcales bacterium]|nr:FIST C-terminal domain-containing protein [Myxococcales bacterium]
MRWASSISGVESFDVALEQTTEELRAALDGEAPDLLLVFVSREHQHRWHELPGQLRDRFANARIVGCSAAGVAGDGREIEQAPGLALSAARLPGVEVTPFHLDPDAVDLTTPADPAYERQRWFEALGIADGPAPHLLLLPDPFSWPGPPMLASLDRSFPDAVKIGGLASGGGRPGEHRLFCDRSVHHRGTVGVALRGNLEIESVVAQGCRPIGSPLFITRRQNNIIFELDGRLAVDVLQQVLDELDPGDQALARTSLFLGLSMHPSREIYGQGDFLVRNLIGVDPTTGAIGVGAELDHAAVVQFHLRDAETSAAELRDLLAEHAFASRGHRSQAALMFSCLGRGRSLYGEAGHDSALLREQLGHDLPIAGFFCNGEIGPIGGYNSHTFLHGYTSAVMLFRPATMI